MQEGGRHLAFYVESPMHLVVYGIMHLYVDIRYLSITLIIKLNTLHFPTRNVFFAHANFTFLLAV